MAVLKMADEAIIKKYMDETDELIRLIVNHREAADVSGTKYYVSENGNDDNDGLTPETAWKTINKANRFEGFKSGDGVYLKRGDSWRIKTPLFARSGVTYSAYGEGSKPKLIGSIDASSADLWERTDAENIYKYKYTINTRRNNVGTIIFDNGRAWGVQVQRRKSGTRLDNGTVFNGLETYCVPECPLDSYKDLKGNLEFWQDIDTDNLYLYCKGGNPADVFESIEIVDKGHGIVLVSDEETNTAHDITVNNIEVFGFGSHGVASGNVKNIVVEYCVFKWIGGSVQEFYLFNRDHGVRFGNAVESYGSSDNFIIRWNYASQIYDCCWTVQKVEATTMNNIQMYKNVSEFCNTGLEVWQDGGTISNMKLYDNYTRFNGYGWSHQRPKKHGNFFFGGGNTNCTYINNDVYNNVGLFASLYISKCAATGVGQYNFHDNVYIMENDKYVGGVTRNPGTGTGDVINMPYNEAEVSLAVDGGFEKGTQFYVTAPSPLGNMFDLYDRHKTYEE
ncbi:MAG: hypothetical protein E7672_09490 [Ruminococcaceae bacterium]|nr:hypothetical protein [Oscillospiraceae bacterium]